MATEKKKENIARPQMDFNPSRTSYSYGNPLLWYLVKVMGSAPCTLPSQTPATHSYPGPFSLLA